MATIASLIATTAGLSACASPAGPKQPGEPVASQAGSTLTVRVTPSPDAPTKVWMLTCQPPGGTHPDPGAACATLTKLTHAGNPFAEPPKGQICTQIYGGPQTAKIEGEWRGKAVAADYSRRNGCAMKTWDELKPVLAPGATSSPTK